MSRLAVARAGMFGAFLCAAAGGCEKAGPPRYGEALLVVDTDLPVPQIAGRFRVDLYAADGTWYESRDISRPSGADWPVTFSVFSSDESTERRVLVRLRVYPQGIVRDYLGERFVDRGAPPSPVSADANGPRLVRDGVDVTPATEPKPSVAVDRLVLLRLVPGKAGRVRVTMRGACIGTMALLSADEPHTSVVLSEAQTCLDTEGERQAVSESELDPDMSVPPATQLGTFGVRAACDPDVAPDPRAVCVPGGVFVLGSSSVVEVFPYTGAVPERITVLDPFWIDRDEVTVAQYRAAVSAGFHAPAGLVPHEGPLGRLVSGESDADQAWCTFSSAPRGREDYALSCVSWVLARAYCQFLGGDLPTEAQWEYAATAAGRSTKTDFPWGDDMPSCDRAVWGRPDPAFGFSANCQPIGPRPISAAPDDVTPLGIRGMGGGVSEWVLDALAEYTDPCWSGAPLANPWCASGQPGMRIMRGGAWPLAAVAVASAERDFNGEVNAASRTGIRCAFDHPPGKP